MKKRAAMTLAGALVTALLAGSVAMSMGLTGAEPVSAANGRVQPRIRTVERTITVHKKAKADASPVVRTIAPAAPTTSTVSAPAAQTTAYDDDWDDDDRFEDEDEGDDDHGEDHSDDGDHDEDHEDEGEDD
jgi:hypothetical protein